LLFVTPVKNDNSFRIGPNSNALQSGGIGSTAQQDEDSGPSTLPAEEETDSAGQGSSAGAALPVAPARIVPRGPQLLSAPAAIPLKN
jgi:hypothetical protein